MRSFLLPSTGLNTVLDAHFISENLRSFAIDSSLNDVYIFE